MEYAYATCILSETGEEINQENLTAVLEAAGCSVIESRVKAIVAALEDVDVSEVAAIDREEIEAVTDEERTESPTDSGVSAVDDAETADTPNSGDAKRTADERDSDRTADERDSDALEAPSSAENANER